MISAWRDLDLHKGTMVSLRITGPNRLWHCDDCGTDDLSNMSWLRLWLEFLPGPAPNRCGDQNDKQGHVAWG